MKMTLPYAVASAVLFAATAHIHAAPYAPNPYPEEPYYTRGPFYISADIGGVILQDTTAKNAGAKIAFNPGVRGDLTFGYQIAPPIAVEFETGSIWNSLSTQNGLYISASGLNVDLFQIPFLANLVFRLPPRNGFSAYIGGGVGGVASQFDVSNPNDNGGFFNSENHITDTDVTFAYQGKIGLTYSFNPNMEVGVGYKFLGTLDHTWFKGDPAFFTHTDPIYSHSFLASFTWKF